MSMDGTRTRERYSWYHTWMRRRWMLLKSLGMMNSMIMTFWWSCWATGLTQRRGYQHPGLDFMAGHDVTTRMRTPSPMPSQNCAELATHIALRSSAKSWSANNVCVDNRIRSSKSTYGWWFVPRRTGSSRHWLRCARILPGLVRLLISIDRLSRPLQWSNEDSEEMFVMMDRSQWTGQGISEPTIPPALAQMFTVARRMGYEMRPVARRSSQPPGSPRAPLTSGQGYRQPFRQGRDFSKVKCLSCGQMGHTQARCPKPDATLPFKPSGWNVQPDGQQQRITSSSPGNAI